MSKAPAAPTPESTDAPPAKKKSAFMGLVMAIAFVSVVVILEVAAAAVMFPTAEETRAIGEQLAKGGEGKHAGGTAEEAEGAEGEGGEGAAAGEHTKELSLGTYHIVSFNPKTRTTVSLDFELFGVVLAEEEQEFNELFLVHEKRINEQVTISMRGMELTDFMDPSLGLMKRVILEKTNRALGKPVIREIVVVGFSIISR